MRLQLVLLLLIALVGSATIAVRSTDNSTSQPISSIDEAQIEIMIYDQISNLTTKDYFDKQLAPIVRLAVQNGQQFIAVGSSVSDLTQMKVATPVSNAAVLSKEAKTTSTYFGEIVKIIKSYLSSSRNTQQTAELQKSVKNLGSTFDAAAVSKGAAAAATAPKVVAKPIDVPAAEKINPVLSVHNTIAFPTIAPTAAVFPTVAAAPKAPTVPSVAAVPNNPIPSVVAVPKAEAPSEQVNTPAADKKAPVAGETAGTDKVSPDTKSGAANSGKQGAAAPVAGGAAGGAAAGEVAGSTDKVGSSNNQDAPAAAPVPAASNSEQQLIDQLGNLLKGALPAGQAQEAAGVAAALLGGAPGQAKTLTLNGVAVTMGGGANGDAAGKILQYGGLGLAVFGIISAHTAVSGSTSVVQFATVPTTYTMTGTNDPAFKGWVTETVHVTGANTGPPAAAAASVVAAANQPGPSVITTVINPTQVAAGQSVITVSADPNKFQNGVITVTASPSVIAAGGVVTVTAVPAPVPQPQAMPYNGAYMGPYNYYGAAYNNPYYYPQQQPPVQPAVQPVMINPQTMNTAQFRYVTLQLQNVG